MDAYDKCTNLRKNLANNIAIYGWGQELFRPPTYMFMSQDQNTGWSQGMKMFWNCGRVQIFGNILNKSKILFRNRLTADLGQWMLALILSRIFFSSSFVSNNLKIKICRTMYRNLSNIPRWKLAPSAEEIIGEHQFGFRNKRSTTDHIFCIRREYNKAVCQFIIDLRKAYVSVRREVLYNVLIEFGIPMKLVRLINLYLTETLLILSTWSCLRIRMQDGVKI
jgi:hypothetical protein